MRLDIEFEGGDNGERDEEQQVAADLYYGSHDGDWKDEWRFQ